MNARVRSVVAGAWACVGLSLTACGGDGGGTTPNGPSVAKANPSGDAQTGTVNAALANPLRVVVMDDGAPAVGVTVTWSIVSGGGSVNPTSSITGADGIATTTWTLSTVSGAKTARATVAGATGSPLNFTATASPGPVTAIVVQFGNGFTGSVGSNTPNALGAKLTDQYGNGTPGGLVGWTTTAGTATVTALTSLADAQGIARIGVGLPLVGASTIEADFGVIGPATFTVNAVAVIGTTDIAVLPTLAFDPAAVTVAVGTQIRWTLTNTGAVQHNVTSTGATTFTSSGTLTGNGTTYTVNLVTAGTYTYQCTFHAGMNGTITVQ